MVVLTVDNLDYMMDKMVLRMVALSAEMKDYLMGFWKAE